MSKPGKVLRNLCKKLGVRLTVKRGKKRVYKSIAVLKRQCKKKKVVKRKRRRRRFGASLAVESDEDYYKAKYDFKTGKQYCTPCKKNPKAEKDDCRFNSISQCMEFVSTPHSVEKPQELYNKVMDVNDLRRTIMSHHSDENSIRESMFKMIAKYNRARSLIQEKMAIPGDYIKNLQGADLRGADLRRANFRRANLRGADLIMAELVRADLQGANLREAYLGGANLHGADLLGADLRGANLEGAHLRTADLRGANLLEADLQDAYLDSADLRGANLRKAYLGGANLHGADLRRAKLQRAVLDWARLVGAKYDNTTQFPEGFNPLQVGMVRANNFGKKRRKVKKKKKSKNNFLGILIMSKPGKSLRNLCKKWGYV